MQTALKLPLVVKAGTIGRVELRIPWAKPNSEPTQLILDVRRASHRIEWPITALPRPAPAHRMPPPRPATQDLFIICGPQSETAWDAEAEEAEIKAKLECLAAREKQQIVVRDEDAERQNASFASKLTQAVLDRLQVRVSNVTVRYEDRSHGAVPYSISLQLRSLEVQNGTAPQQSSPDQPGSSASIEFLLGGMIIEPWAATSAGMMTKRRRKATIVTCRRCGRWRSRPTPQQGGRCI